MRGLSWTPLLCAVLALAGGAKGTTEPSGPADNLDEPTTVEPDPEPRQDPVQAIPTEPSTWFDIDDSHLQGWYSEAERDEVLPRWLTHESLPRDTIESVAARYGVPASRLRRWNGMSETARLNPREPKRLRVKARRFPPPRERVIHTVVEGDTWDSLGRDYGVFDRYLRARNREQVGKTLEVGEHVWVWVEPMVRSDMRAGGLASLRAAAIPAGAHGIGTPQQGHLVAGVQIPTGEGYLLRFPNSSYGTTFAVRHLVDTLDHFHETSGYRGTLMIGSMSFRHGGKIRPHVSHQSGRDVDIRLPMRPGLGPEHPASGRNVEWQAAWKLVLDFALSGAVETIFLDYRVQRKLFRIARAEGASPQLLDQIFQYPRGSRSNFGIVRHSSGHEGHIHVRYACGPFEPSCGGD